MTDIIINGAQGKMGRLIKQIIEEQYQGKAHIVQLRDKDTQEPAPRADVIIDFSLPQGALAAYQTAKEIKAALLCGTTNLDEAFLSRLKAEKEIPVFYSANVSIGVFLFGKLLQEACSLFKDYEPKMHEAHHAQKKDAPSGTAKALAKLINFPQDKITFERIGTVPGTHILDLHSHNGDETITITHKALDRRLFAASAVKIALWLAGKKPGFYDMKDFTENLL